VNQAENLTKTRIEFACFRFRVGLLFLSTFRFFKPGTENNANFGSVSSKRSTFDDVLFSKHIAKHIIIGTHNLQTFKHNTLINELGLLLMQFYLFNIRPILGLNRITGSWENYASHCFKLSQLHQEPVDAVLRPTFIWKLCYKLPSVVTLTFMPTFGQTLLNGAMFTGSVTRNFPQNALF